VAGGPALTIRGPHEEEDVALRVGALHMANKVLTIAAAGEEHPLSVDDENRRLWRRFNVHDTMDAL